MFELGESNHPPVDAEKLTRLLALSVRLWGLVKFAGGIALMFPVYLLLRWLGERSGHVHVEGAAALPLVVSLQGWIELILGIRFMDIARRFDQASGSGKFLIALGVLGLVGVYAAIALWLYYPYS